MAAGRGTSSYSGASPTPNYAALAMRTAQRYGIPPQLFVSLVRQESGFNPRARSPVGAQWLTQLMPATARGLGVTNPWDPQQNLEGGAKYLSQQYKRFGTWGKALAAYNAGPGAVESGKWRSYGETTAYVRNILGSSGDLSAPAMAAPAGSTDLGSTTSVTAPPVDAQRQAVLDALSQNREMLGNVGTWAGAPAVGGKFKASPYAQLASKLTAAAAHVDPGAGAAATMASVVGRTAPRQGTSSSTKATSYAESFVGTPYSWGGGTPAGPSFGIGRGKTTRGFDCSSLVQAAWAHQGIMLPRTTQQQIKVGRAIGSLAEAQPGDLLFPSTTHVQMYLGNGKVIEAPFTGGRVRIVPVRNRYIAIRRPSG